MQIGAVQKFSTLDFPGKTACVVFTAGCNFRCGYCHNPELVVPEQILELRDHMIPQDVFFAFLERRKGLIEGVAITGGEPTLQNGLPNFLRKIREMGFETKLDTNGSLPEMLEPILDAGLVDYVAMDVKTSLERYAELANACLRPDAVKQSIELIKNKAPDYEFRTTILTEHHDVETLKRVRELIRGAKRFALQGFRPAHTLEPEYQRKTLVSREELEVIEALFLDEVEEILIRV